MLEQRDIALPLSVECRDECLKGCFYGVGHPTLMEYLTTVRSQQNGEFHFLKTNRLRENGFIPPISVKSHLNKG